MKDFYGRHGGLPHQACFTPLLQNELNSKEFLSSHEYFLISRCIRL